MSIYNAATTEYQVLDEFGNDISSTWPGYNEETGMVSPILDKITGKYSVKVPQYVKLKEGEEEKTFKVIEFNVMTNNNNQYSELDCSEAPDIRIFGSSTDYSGSGIERIILPENLVQFNCMMPGKKELECDFSVSPDLEFVNLAWGASALLDLDLSENTKLREFNIDYSNNDFSLKLPQTDSLERLRINNNSGFGNLRNIDFTQYPNLKSIDLYRPNISEIDLSAQEKLESLTLIEARINELDLSNNPLLEKLCIYNLDIRNLDISENDNLTTLILSNLEDSKRQLLETFTGNGKVMPPLRGWFSDEEKTNEVFKCSKGQTIYSMIYEAPDKKKTVNKIKEGTKNDEVISTPSNATPSNALSTTNIKAKNKKVKFLNILCKS